MDPEWKVTPVSGPRCWQRMFLQMVQYKSSNVQYPGDKKMHKNIQMNKKNRGTSDIGLMECEDHIKRVSYLLYLYEKKTQGGKKTRLCAGNMMLLKQLLNSLKRVHVALVKCVAKNIHGVSDMQEDVCFKSGKSMSSLSCCIDIHDDLICMV